MGRNYTEWCRISGKSSKTASKTAKKQAFWVKKILDVQFNQQLQYVTKGKKTSM